MKNKIVKLGLILGVFAVSPAFAFAGTFPDVPEDHENYEAIEFLKAREYINGYSDLTFQPDKGIARAEAVKIIVSALEVPHDGDYIVLFGDVPSGEWFFPYVMGAKKAGIVKGDDNGLFRPGDPINLAESLKIVSEALDVEIPDVVDEPGMKVFADVPASSWFAGYATYAKDKNIVLMDDYGEVHASDPMTRGAFAEIMYRFIYVDESGGEPFPLDSDWVYYESSVVPFGVKFPPSWDILRYSENGLDGVVFWGDDKGYFQFSPERVYPNTSKFVVTLDKNENELSQGEYFSNIKMVFGTGTTTGFEFGGFDALEVSFAEDYVKDWYIYLDNGSVLVVYTQNGGGVLADQNRKFLDAMLASFEHKEGLVVEGGADYLDLKGQIYENILVEGKGQEMLNSLPDKVIIETDSIGVGTGPIDYYYSLEVDITLKYERASDVLLDYREGQTTAF